MPVDFRVSYEVEEKGIQLDDSIIKLKEYLTNEEFNFLKNMEDYFIQKLDKFERDFTLILSYEKHYIGDELRHGLIAAWVDEDSSYNPERDLISFFDSLEDFNFNHPIRDLSYTGYDYQDTNYIWLV